jgi:hypothetical protein
MRPAMDEIHPFEEVALSSLVEVESSTSATESARPSIRKEDLIPLARRHPATIALIDEITAAVTARSEQRLELAASQIRERRLWNVPVGDRALVLFGGFATVNLLLVTLVLAMAQVMPAWLAALLVSTGTSGATAMVVLRRSPGAFGRLPFLRKLAVRKFAARLFANP